MGAHRALWLLVAVAVATPATARDGELVTASLCEARGFQAGALACSTCVKLERALRPLGAAAGAVVDDCTACCSVTLDAVAPVRFTTAELSVCRFSLAQHGGVNEFLEKSLWRGAVTVTDVLGAPPVLTLRKAAAPADGAAASSGLATEPPLRLNVGAWKIEHIEALLALKTTLAPATPSPEPTAAASSS